jgi:peptidyl-prolyl cis-trans isomerase D
MALGFIRQHRRWLNVILWLVVAAFIIFYVPAFLGDGVGSPGETIGRVGGKPIAFTEYQSLYFRRLKALDRAYEGRLDAAMARRMGLPQQIFMGIVQQRLIQLECKRLGLVIDDATLARAISQSPRFQSQGRYVGSAQLRYILKEQGMSEREFTEEERLRLMSEQLEAVVTAGVQVSDGELERDFRRQNEQVKAEYVLVDEGRFRSAAKVSDDEVKKQFEANREGYRLPERRVVSYLMLERASFAKQVNVTTREIETYFHDHTEEFTQPEQVCASHILIKVRASEENKQGHADDEAKKLAASLLEQVKKGADFATLAKKSSEDEGSAKAGGDLQCFERRRMVPEFDEAAFALQAGETSELVKSTYGYHIIRVTERRAEVTPPLEAVQARIRQTLLAQRTEELFEKKTESAAAILRRGKPLQDAAQAIGLTVAVSQPLARGEALPPLGSPVLVARAFELKPNQAHPEPFSLPPGAAFIALKEVQPSRLPELAEVQQKVRDELVEKQALQQARAVAEQLRTQAEKVGLDKAAAALGLVRKETPSPVGRGMPLGELGLNAALEAAAYDSPEKILSQPLRVANGLAVLRVSEHKPFDPTAFAKEKTTLKATLLASKRRELYEAYLAGLWERYSVERTEGYKRILGVE